VEVDFFGLIGDFAARVVALPNAAAADTEIKKPFFKKSRLLSLEHFQSHELLFLLALRLKEYVRFLLLYLSILPPI